MIAFLKAQPWRQMVVGGSLSGASVLLLDLHGLHALAVGGLIGVVVPTVTEVRRLIGEVERLSRRMDYHSVAWADTEDSLERTRQRVGALQVRVTDLAEDIDRTSL